VNESLVADKIEALLFVASEPLTAGQLADSLSLPPGEVTAATQELGSRLTGGLRLSHLDGRYRLVTAPELAATVRKFLQDEAKTELSKAALETLAIVAYRGPVAKGAIEQIRGVASETMLRNLIARGLIEEAGRAREPGRPQLYAVSQEFLHQFGLTSTNDLPPIPEAASEN
jgi:segregation and condensation protein B